MYVVQKRKDADRTSQRIAEPEPLNTAICPHDPQIKNISTSIHALVRGITSNPTAALRLRDLQIKTMRNSHARPPKGTVLTPTVSLWAPGILHARLLTDLQPRRPSHSRLPGPLPPWGLSTRAVLTLKAKAFTLACNRASSRYAG